MPRLPRVHIDGSLYYITCQSHHSNELFKDSQDYDKYLDLLANCKNKYQFKLFSYCLLSDKVYLLIGVNPESSISEIMFSLNSSYTKYYNARQGKKGSVLEGRFKSKWVEKKTYLLPLTKYIHLLSGKNYLYTSYPAFLGKPSQILMKDEINETLSYLSEGIDYKTYVENIDSRELKSLGQKLSRNRILGSVQFQEKVKAVVKDYQAGSKNNKKLQIAPEKKELVLKKRMPMRLVFQNAGLSILVLFIITGYFYVNQFSGNRDIGVKITKEESNKNLLALNNAQIQSNPPVAEQKAAISSKALVLEKEVKAVSNTLENVAWEIKLRPVSSVISEEAQLDTLTFKEGKFVSNIFTKEGFSSSRYSVRYKSEGIIVWETMQTKEDGTTANWYGEYNGNTMKGVLSETPASGRIQEFSFVSTKYSREG